MATQDNKKVKLQKSNSYYHSWLWHILELLIYVHTYIFIKKRDCRLIIGCRKYDHHARSQGTTIIIYCWGAYSYLWALSEWPSQIMWSKGEFKDSCLILSSRLTHLIQGKNIFFVAKDFIRRLRCYYYPELKSSILRFAVCARLFMKKRVNLCFIKGTHNVHSRPTPSCACGNLFLSFLPHLSFLVRQ